VRFTGISPAPGTEHEHIANNKKNNGQYGRYFGDPCQGLAAGEIPENITQDKYHTGYKKYS
jgi:hypothetical protein